MMPAVVGAFLIVLWLLGVEGWNVRAGAINAALAAGIFLLGWHLLAEKSKPIAPGWRYFVLAIIGILLIISWFLGFIAFHVTVTAIHLALAIGILLLILHLFRGKKSAA